MSSRRKRFVFFPLGGLLLAALVVFLLGQFGVLSLPWGPGASDAALAAEGSENGEKSDGEDDEEEIIPVPVELARARARRISAFYRASSFVEAHRHVDLVAKIPGRVQKVNVEEGDWVKSGDVLAELENARERIQLHQAELRRDEQSRELERRRSMLEKNLITQEEFDGSRSAFDLSVADQDLGKIRVEETLIRAPFDGQVTDRKIVPGQHIEMSEALFTLVDLEPLRIRIHLPEVIARKIGVGDRVQVRAEALDAPVEAAVERISPVVDPMTSTVRLTLLVREGAEDLRVGGFVKVRITTDTHTEALSIPKIALVEEGGLRSVFVADADSVKKIEVRTGLWDESHVEILDGIEEGAYVVSLGQGGLRTGSRIDVLNARAVGWVSPAPEGEDGSEEQESEDGGALVAENDSAEELEPADDEDAGAAS
jgi:RND family efflux transporter MFP subunit